MRMSRKTRFDDMAEVNKYELETSATLMDWKLNEEMLAAALEVVEAALRKFDWTAMRRGGGKVSLELDVGRVVVRVVARHGESRADFQASILKDFDGGVRF